MGEAEEKAGQPAEAGESYRRYLRAVPDASDRAEIEQRLARLGPAGAPPATPADAHEIPGAFGQGPPPPAPSPATRAGRASTGAGARRAAARDDETGPGAGAEEEASGWNALQRHGLGRDRRDGGAARHGRATTQPRPPRPRTTSTSSCATRTRCPARRSSTTRWPRATRAAIRDGQHDDRVAKDALFVAAGTAMVATAFFIVDSVRRARRARRRPPA